MTLHDDVAQIAGLIGEKARATMLIALMEGKAITAGELAIRANISAQTASNHLNKLVKANLVVCERAGRHRYYKLSSEHVAHVLESLGLLTEPNKKRPPRHNKLDKDICFARTCYDHLAGEIGVKVTKTLLLEGIITQKKDSFHVTEYGKQFFDKLGIDVNELMNQRRQFAKPCLDWTEREYHIAGSLGSAILDYFLKNRLFIRSKNKPRVMVLTTKGRNWLAQMLDIRG